MQLTEYGHIVELCWNDLPQEYSNLILDAFVIMPDHIHGIMFIDNDIVHGIFEFVLAFKTFSSRRMNELDNTTGKQRCQSRFYDRVIHDEPELDRIRQHIHNNPKAWETDREK